MELDKLYNMIESLDRLSNMLEIKSTDENIEYMYGIKATIKAMLKEVGVNNETNH